MPTKNVSTKSDPNSNNLSFPACADPAFEESAPLQAPKSPPGPVENESPQSDSADAGDLKGLYCSGEVRVLVMDDDVDIGVMIETALEPRGFVIDRLANPMELKEKLQDQQYHLIILDYVLPGVDTDQVLDWIQESQDHASIIVVTAYPTMDSALNCLRAHTYDYITKPFSIHMLVERVTRCLESRGLLRLSEEALRESLGRAIRERRKSMELTLAQMANRTGISLGYLSQIELGKNSASVETLYRISLGLAVRLGELFQTLDLDI